MDMDHGMILDIHCCVGGIRVPHRIPVLARLCKITHRKVTPLRAGSSGDSLARTQLVPVRASGKETQGRLSSPLGPFELHKWLFLFLFF